MPARTGKIDTTLFQFATVRQLEILEAIDKHGSMRAATKALGCNYTTVHQAFQRVLHKAALHGYSPEHDLTRPVAPGQKLRGASTLYRRGEPEPVLQWVKSSADDEARDAILREAAAAMSAELPRVVPAIGPAEFDFDLCNVYTITDAHVGALAWHKEGGADWDLRIAEQTLTQCLEYLIASAPAAETCIVNQLGDYLHIDGLLPMTPTSGHVLDADGRFSKIVGVAIRVLRRIVGFALQRHHRVFLLIAEGNHDQASSVWLRHMFAALYEHEPRLNMIESELPYYAHQHGKCLIGFHHGHLKKTTELPILFAAQFPEIWGATRKRVVHTGHRHHVEEKEHSGITIHQHPTLAARDAYAARGGWIAERKVTALSYHREWGEVARATVTPEMMQ